MERWEQQPGETARAFEAAQVYFRMGPGRSLDLVAQDLSKSLPLIKRWSSKHEWVERAGEWDQHMAAVEQRAMEAQTFERAQKRAELRLARQEQLEDQEWETAQAMLNRTKIMLRFPVEAQEVKQEEGGKVLITIVKPIKWTAADIAKLNLAASKLARLSTGAVTDRPGTINWDELSDEQLERAVKTGTL